MNEDAILLKIKKYGYPMKGSTERFRATTNFCGYYTDQLKSNLIHFQNLYTLADKFEEKRNNSIKMYLDSIWTKYEYILFNKDQIVAIHQNCDIDNDSQFLIECFLYNFVILTYSILDSLAWIIHHWYELSLHRQQITLNFTDKDKFKKEIQKLNQPLAEFLKNNQTQKWIQYFKEYRDQIQHRHKVHVMPEEGPNYKRMVIERKPGLHQYYPNLSFSSFEDAYMPVQQEYGDTMQPVLDFCNEHFNQVTKIIETVSSSLKDSSS